MISSKLLWCLLGASIFIQCRLVSSYIMFGRKIPDRGPAASTSGFNFSMAHFQEENVSQSDLNEFQQRAMIHTQSAIYGHIISMQGKYLSPVRDYMRIRCNFVNYFETQNGSIVNKTETRPFIQVPFKIDKTCEDFIINGEVVTKNGKEVKFKLWLPLKNDFWCEMTLDEEGRILPGTSYYTVKFENFRILICNPLSGDGLVDIEWIMQLQDGTRENIGSGPFEGGLRGELERRKIPLATDQPNNEGGVEQQAPSNGRPAAPTNDLIVSDDLQVDSSNDFGNAQQSGEIEVENVVDKIILPSPIESQNVGEPENEVSVDETGWHHTLAWIASIIASFLNLGITAYGK